MGKCISVPEVRVDREIRRGLNRAPRSLAFVPLSFLSSNFGKDVEWLLFVAWVKLVMQTKCCQWRIDDCLVLTDRCVLVLGPSAASCDHCLPPRRLAAKQSQKPSRAR